MIDIGNPITDNNTRIESLPDEARARTTRDPT
jgi:hypothetical protein